MSHAWEQTSNKNVILTSLEKLVAWGRKHSLWPYAFATSCCASEFAATQAADFDLARFGIEMAHFSPKQADLLLVLGTVTCKQAPILKQIYDQMPEPKWVISVGACASSGGAYRNYSTVQGIDGLIPVDIYVPGCPPRPEAILEAVVQLQNKIEADGFARDRGESTGERLSLLEAESYHGKVIATTKREAARKHTDGVKRQLL